MARYRASWVVPVDAPPIRDGVVTVRGGRVVSVGVASDPSDTGWTDGPRLDLPGYALLPALVNAHTHLELSGLRDTIGPSETMPGWARQAMDRMAVTPPDPAAITGAIRESRDAGTGLVGDVSNTLASVRPLVSEELPAVVFRELLGFDERQPDDVVRQAVAALAARLAGQATPLVRPGLAAHAPYSTSPELFRSIRAVARAQAMSPMSVHLAESAEELRFLSTGTGAWRQILEARGRWRDDWTPPAGSPVAYLQALGWVTADLVAVHGVHLTDAELTTLAGAGASLVTCPRSNQWTGAGRPPVARFYASGVRLAVGTDSLASAPDLNVFSELATLRELAPDVPARRILATGTVAGAEALGWFDRGCIRPGMREAFIAVRCPGEVDDVEEYLLGGISPDQVTWPRHPVSP